MTRAFRTWTFHSFLVVVFASNVAFSEALSCEIGAKIRQFDKQDWKVKSPGTEKFLLDITSDSVFAYDDEKYIKALIHLLEYSGSKANAIEKITGFIDKPLMPGVSAASRERKANALFRILESKDESLSFTKSRVLRLLSIEFPETVAAKKAVTPELSLQDWLRRIELLSVRNENALILLEISQKHPNLALTDAHSCRVGFLLGKALRNTKKYQEAREQLSQVSLKCTGDDARDALFLLARLAAISPNKENLKIFDDFEKKYPKHSYVDDVLLFKASALDSLGRREEAKQTLAAISRLDYPADMKLEAEFRLAYLYALEGNSVEAIRVLKAAIDAKPEVSGPLLQQQRIKYWHARLQLFPDLLTFKKAPNFALLDAPKKMLQELANAAPWTFYSWLSIELLKEMALPRSAPKITKEPSRLTTPITDPYFKTCLCLLQGKYAEEGRHLIEIAEPIFVSVEQRMAIAQKLNERGLAADAFRFAQSMGGADAELKDDFATLTLFYPKAHSQEVERAAKQIGIPSNLLYGLMREESRFDYRAISWAGARGLFQLMPHVAREEGMKFKMMNLSDEAILDPKVNILLGAEHLKGMIEKLDHPLFGVAAYNAGFKSANDWQEKYRTFKAIDAFVENIPFPETRGYVKRVASSWVNYARIYSNIDDLFALSVDESSSSKKVR